MKTKLFIQLFCLLVIFNYSKAQVSQTPSDSTLSQDEKRFNDSVAAVNQASQTLQEAHEAYNVVIEKFKNNHIYESIALFDKAILLKPDFV